MSGCVGDARHQCDGDVVFGITGLGNDVVVRFSAFG